MLVPFGAIPDHLLKPLHVDTTLQYNVKKLKLPNSKDPSYLESTLILAATLDLPHTASNSSDCCCCNSTPLQLPASSKTHYTGFGTNAAGFNLETACLFAGGYVVVSVYNQSFLEEAHRLNDKEMLTSKLQKLFLRDAVVRRLRENNQSHLNSPTNQPLGICVRKFGRLGNQMFEVAALLGIVHVNGMKAFVEADSDLIGLFEMPDVVIKPVGKCEDLAVHHEKNRSVFNMSFTHFDRPLHGDVSIAGYFQSWRYFHHISDIIRRQFTLRPSIRQLALEALTKAIVSQRKSMDLISSTTYVALHVRRNDMMNPDRKKLGNNVAPASYIISAQNYFRHLFHDVLFIAGSDDMSWVKSNVPSFDTVYLEGNSGAVDFAVLSMCEHTIFTVGTFGWWAAWLSNGKTIYYKHQFNSNAAPQQFMNIHDYMFPPWIPME
ncbi:galactoside alpha-(1,2)-fucosyltransferase 2-like [Liolophura sinensis]|uniref:galactoside alpha-(1,2)-fucosyltransferase 2-like n=1 Tax=Liolophura sinensis TaxID=3198878 RepID=UPI0031581748